MKIGKVAVVGVSVEMLDESGAASSAQEFRYLHGGYGNLSPKLLQRADRHTLRQPAALHGQARGGRRPLTALSDTEATLDGNHPLAGRTVELRCEVLEVRAATPEEIEHGHVHGPHGHSH